MNTPIKITVPSLPVAQPRQRHRIAGARNRPYVQNYVATKHPVNAFKAAVQMAFSLAVNGHDQSEIPTNAPVTLRIVFWMPRPKNRVWKTKPMPAEPHAKKPDIDNLCKSVMDALHGLAWRDDSQVCEVTASKLICGGDDSPHVYCEISETDQSI